MSKLILINNLVRKKEIFEQSCSEDTSYLVVEASLDYRTFGTREGIKVTTGLTHLCLLFDNTGKKAPYFIYDDEELLQYQNYLDSINNEVVNDDEIPNSNSVGKGHFDVPSSKFLTSTTSFLSPSFMTFIKNYKLNNPSLQYLDLITCNVSEEMIKDQAEELLSVGITVRYSTNFTGKDGDWILESHNVNVTDIYFKSSDGNTSVKDYPYQLGIGDEPPLLITTEEHLYNLMNSTDVTTGGVLTRNYTLGNDIDMTKLDQNLYPAQSIGKSTSFKFTGSFNGNNYTITIGNVDTTGLFCGLFGFTNLVNGNSIQNITIIYKNSTTLVSTASGFTYAGCLVGWNIGNINNCNIVCSSNMTFNGYYSGGLIGYAQGPNSQSIVSTINNCNIIFLGNVTMNGGHTCGGIVGYSSCNINFCVNIFGSQTTINGTRLGGLVGNTAKDSNLLNCICIYGNSVTISGTNVAGIIGINSGGNLSTTTSCFCFVNNYTIYGTTANNIICTTVPFTTINSCNVHSFGTALTGQGITTIPSSINTIFSLISTTFPETEWIIPLVRIRQKLASNNTVVTNPSTIVTNNTTYFSQILGSNQYSTNVPIFIKNNAISLSLSYSNQNSIISQFNIIKNLLTSKSQLQDSLQIEYLSTPSNNIFITEKGKVYYTPETTGTLTSNNVSATFDVSVSPLGVYFDTTNFRKIGQVYSKNGIDFSVYGVSSGLFGISETGSKLYIGEIDLKNPTSGYDIITNSLTGLYYNTYKMAPLYTGNLIHVDAVYGDDTAAVVTSQSRYNIPFKTIQAALNVAVSGQTVLVYPGTYNEAITMTTSNVSLRGVSVQTVKIQQVDVTSSTTLVTLGQNCRIEDVTLTLSSSSNSNINLIGVDIQSGASITSKLRTLVLNVNYTGTGTGNIYGIYSSGTSSTTNTSSNTIRASTINVTSTANGVCRGILVSGDNLVSTRDTNIYASGTGTDIIGCETSNASAHLDLNTSTVSGVLQDIKRTNGDILLSSTNLVNNNAGTQSFSIDSAGETLIFGISGNLANGPVTYNLVPSVLPKNSLSTIPGEEFKFSFPQKINLINMTMTFLPEPLPSGVVLNFSIYKNNVLALSLIGNDTTDFPYTKSDQSIQITPNDTIYAILSVTGNPPSGTIMIQCELY